MNIKEAFFKDMTESLEYWVEKTLSEFEDSRRDLHEDKIKSICTVLAENGIDENDLKNILFNSMKGISHSFLTILDGATSLSDDGRKIFLVDKDGRTLGEGLHEDFIGYLFDTNRLE